MTLTEPQVWALIGVFAAAMFGTLGLVIPLTNRATRDAVDGLRGVVEGGFKAVDARFEVVNARLDHLDRDITAISKKVFDLPE
jgi:hypothetical protein